MKRRISLALTATALLLLASAKLFGQTTGVSHPEDLDDTQPAIPSDGSHYVKPTHDSVSATVTIATPAPTPVLQQRVPTYASSPQYTPQTTQLQPTDPALAVTDDPNSGVVTSVPVGPDEIPIGTRLKATLQQPISTQTTRQGTRFTATLSSDVTRNGLVLLPAGSTIYGRITQIHGGRRISGPSAIRLQPETISLPDGTTYAMRAEVTDLDHFEDSHVNGEGTIVGNTHPGETAAAVGLTTTSAVIAGAVIGGGVGAVVGLGVGAGAATIWWLKHDRQQELPTGTQMVFTLNDPMHISPVAH